MGFVSLYKWNYWLQVLGINATAGILGASSDLDSYSFMQKLVSPQNGAA